MGGKRIVLVSVVAATALASQGTAAAVPAAPTAPSAEGALGAVHVHVDGQPVTVEDIAPCRTDGVGDGTSTGTDVGEIARYGPGETTCSRAQDGSATAQATGRRFETDVLTRYGGPAISFRTFSAGCATTGSGSTGSIHLDGVSGFSVPSQIPPNYVVRIPGPAPGDPVAAEIVLNELVVPQPPDGGLVTHTAHLTLYPDGGPVTGDIQVGTARCAPAGRATPVAG